MRENERLQGEIRRSTDEVADLQFQLLRYQTPALTGVDASSEETKAVTAPATKGGAEEQEEPMTPATPPDAVRSSSANSSLLLESPGWGLSTELMSMADALEKDFMLRSTVAQQPEPMPQRQQQRQQPVGKRSVKSQSTSDDDRGNTAAPELSAHTSPSSTSPAGSVGRRSRLSLQRRKSEAANMRTEGAKSDETQQKAREKEREERERRERAKKEKEERERMEKEKEERERREKEKERERKEKEERERSEKEERERREKKERTEKEERERERREREKKEKEERERERREKEKTEQEEKERKRKEKEEQEANEKAREKQKRSEAMSASGPSRGQARGVQQGGQTGGPDGRASRPTGLKEGKRAIDETREDVETAQAPHAGRPPAASAEENRSPTKKQKVDDQQDEGTLYLDGINLLRAEQNCEDGRTSITQPAKRPKSLKKQLEEERLQRDYRSIRSFFSFNAKKPAADGAPTAVSPRLSPPRQIAVAAASPPRTEPADPPPAPAEASREEGGGAMADPPQEEAMTDQERKKLARSRARAASDPKKTPRFVFGENCPGCATWMSKSDITSGMQDSAEASQTRCASCKHVFAPSVEVTFSVGREQKEDRKERVHFFDKVRLEAVAKERYKQGGRKSFTITLLAEERTDLFWNLVYHFGSLKDAVCTIFPTLNWNAVFRPSPKTT